MVKFHAISNCLRFLMPPVPQDLFLEMCYEAVRANPRFAVPGVMRPGNGNFVKVLWGANADWVPPEGKGALYLRPLLMGSQVLSDARMSWWGFLKLTRMVHETTAATPTTTTTISSTTIPLSSIIIPLPIPISLSSSTTSSVKISSGKLT